MGQAHSSAAVVSPRYLARVPSKQRRLTWCTAAYDIQGSSGGLSFRFEEGDADFESRLYLVQREIACDQEGQRHGLGPTCRTMTGAER